MPPPCLGILDANWFTRYFRALQGALQANPARVLELMRTAKADYDRASPVTIGQTVGNVLWYNVFGTANATDKLGGTRSAMSCGSISDRRTICA